MIVAATTRSSATQRKLRPLKVLREYTHKLYLLPQQIRQANQLRKELNYLHSALCLSDKCMNCTIDLVLPFTLECGHSFCENCTGHNIWNFFWPTKISKKILKDRTLLAVCSQCSNFTSRSICRHCTAAQDAGSSSASRAKPAPAASTAKPTANPMQPATKVAVQASNRNTRCRNNGRQPNSNATTNTSVSAISPLRLSWKE